MGGQTPAPRPALRRVLVVDPDAGLLAAVKGIVESGRCRVDCAGTAAEALACLEANRYDLVIAEACMPELEAAALHERLAAELRDDLRLLFLAQEPLAAELRAFLLEHRLAWVGKPLHLRRFLDKLDDLLLLPEEEEGAE